MATTMASIEEPFELILPDADLFSFGEAAFDFLAAGPDSKITAFHGFSTFKGVKIETSGFDVNGTIKGTVKSNSWVKLYTVYDLPSSESWKLWVVEFKKDTTQSELRQTAEESDPVDLTVDMSFSAKAKDLQGVKFLRVGFETIKLRLPGEEKNFTILNPDSASGKDQNGQEIPVEFTEV